MKKVVKEISKSKITRIEIIIAIIIFVAIFVNFIFSDILETSNHALSFGDLLFKGKIFDLYKANYQTGVGAFPSSAIAYDFQIVSILSIWNLPLLWAMKVFKSISYIMNTEWINSIHVLLWMKSILIPFLIGSIIVSIKICKIYIKDPIDKKLIVFLYISSPIVLMAIAFFGGYDIISVFFSLLGIYYYLKNKNSLFFCFFSLAISLKLFALLIFIPLILLKEKRILFIIRNIIFGLSITMLGKILFYNAPMYLQSTTKFNGVMISRLFSTGISTPYGSISIFLLLLFVIYFYSYVKKISNENLKYYVLYIPFLIYTSFLLLVLAHPQWAVLCLPYMIMIIYINKQNLKNNLLLNIGFITGYFLIIIRYFFWVFSTTSLKRMFLSRIITKDIVSSSIPLFEKLIKYEPAFEALMLASIIIFAYINFPDKWIKEKQEKKSEIKIDKEIRFLLWIRALIMPAICIIIIYYYIFG